MGRRGAVRRELRVSRQPRPLALHRRDARGEAADGGGELTVVARIERSEMREHPSRISLRSIRATIATISRPAFSFEIEMATAPPAFPPLEKGRDRVGDQGRH